MQSTAQAPSDAMKSSDTSSDAGAMATVDTTIQIEAATGSEVTAVLLKRHPAIAATLKYLEDK